MPHRPTPTDAVALYTCKAYPDLEADDRQYLVPALQRVGLRAVPQLWDRPATEPVGARLIRTPWDYYLRVAEFREFLDGQDGSVPMYNPPALLRWNLDKRYLFALAARGVRIVPTQYLPDLGAIESALPALWDELGELVVKPAISAGSFRTARVPRGGELPRGRTERVRGDTEDSPDPEPEGYLVQPFLPQIAEGEWSLIYFEGELSHAVRKLPVPGDFRVQQHYGGRTEAATAPSGLAAQAQSVLTALSQIPEAASPTPPLYARVDGVMDGDRFLLMELELIEPSLYFAEDPRGADRLAQALRRRID